MTSLQTTVKNNSKYTEDWLPIRNISNGMIVLENKKNISWRQNGWTSW